MNKNNNCAFCNAVKSSSKGNLKLYVLIPAIIFILASICYLIFGANLSNDAKISYSFTANFNTMLEKEEQSDYKDQIDKVINDNGFAITAVSVYTDVVDCGFVYRFVNNKNYSNDQLTEKFENIKDAIEEAYQDVPAFQLSEISKITPQFANIFWKSLLAISVFVLVYFVYMLIRFELFAAIASACGVIFANITLFSLLILFRIPVSSSITTAFFVLTLVITLFNILYFSHIKQMQNDDDNKNLLNSDYILNATESKFLLVFKPMVLASVGLLIAFIVFLILSHQIAFTFLAIDIALTLSIFFGVVLPMNFWGKFYNRENDQRLKSRLEKIKQKATKQENDKDKLVV